MTLIIGARCTDGIILAADRKVIRGGEADYMDKVFQLEGIVLAFEGLTGIRDDFLLLLRSEMNRTRGFTSIYEMKLVVEDIVSDLSRRYCERLGEQGSCAIRDKAKILKACAEGVTLQLMGGCPPYAHRKPGYLKWKSLTTCPFRMELTT